MSPIALFLLSSHSHPATLAAASGSLSMLGQVAGFIFILLAAGLIVMAVERLRGH